MLKEDLNSGTMIRERYAEYTRVVNAAKEAGVIQNTLSEKQIQILSSDVFTLTKRADQAQLERDQAKAERDQAKYERNQAKAEREQADLRIKALEASIICDRRDMASTQPGRTLSILNRSADTEIDGISTGPKPVTSTNSSEPNPANTGTTLTTQLCNSPHSSQ